MNFNFPSFAFKKMFVERSYTSKVSRVVKDGTLEPDCLGSNASASLTVCFALDPLLNFPVNSG